MSTFRDKVAVITGAGSGIGKALAEELARRGAILSLCDLSADRVEAVVESIRQSGGRAVGSVVDVRHYESVKTLIEAAASAHGRLDYVFNNAGIGVIGAAVDVSIEDWRNVLDVNLNGVVHGATVAFSLMVKQGFGHIINIGSIEGLVPVPLNASYVTSKFAVVGLSGALRIEGADQGVKVSVACPGHVHTAIFQDSKMINGDRSKLMKLIPPWAGWTPEKCAKAILRGVEKNKAYIVVSEGAKMLWRTSRFAPNLVFDIMRGVFRRARKIGVISS
ncbi:MAG: SDR family oxidoreductase [Verrucomicrobiaceae bacterium]|nr:SDR family oxidoreductase [Verrucomicrobiaceae bacterium]